jgi:hypothetical protein
MAYLLLPQSHLLRVLNDLIHKLLNETRSALRMLARFSKPTNLCVGRSCRQGRRLRTGFVLTGDSYGYVLFASWVERRAQTRDKESLLRSHGLETSWQRLEQKNRQLRVQREGEREEEEKARIKYQNGNVS